VPSGINRHMNIWLERVWHSLLLSSTSWKAVRIPASQSCNEWQAVGSLVSSDQENSTESWISHLWGIHVHALYSGFFECSTEWRYAKRSREFRCPSTRFVAILMNWWYDKQCQNVVIFQLRRWGLLCLQLGELTDVTDISLLFSSYSLFS
jgi:hypothetical protein